MFCASCTRPPSTWFVVPKHQQLSTDHFTAPRARIDFKYIRDNVDLVAKNCKQRNLPIKKAAIQEVATEYTRFAETTSELNEALARRNTLSSAIKTAEAEDRPSLIEEASKIKPHIHELETLRSEIEDRLLSLASTLPNSTHASAPIGNESKVKIVEYINSENQYTSDDALDHVEICKRLDLVDFDMAAKVSGTGFYYLKNEAVQLENALTQFALQRAVEAGFSMSRPPDLVRSEFIPVCGFQPRDAHGQQIYETSTGGLSLVGTAEIPLAALGLGVVFDENELPKRYVGLGRAFRAEAGARGADTKGLYRVHEFTKVELFSFCTPAQSESEFLHITQLQKRIVKELGLCARILEMPTEELGASAHRKYDIEAWIPSRNDWGEITSASNCTDYQARRLNTRYRPAVTSLTATRALDFVHTLNGTAVAVPRFLVAGLESWTSHGRVKVPECLQPHMWGIKEIGKREPLTDDKKTERK